MDEPLDGINGAGSGRSRTPPLERRDAYRRGMAEIDRLGDEIATLSAQIQAATYELLVRLREFDKRGGWGHHGAKSCAQWLAWRISLDRGAAREWVRVARALEHLPVLSEAMRKGEVSYSKECRPYCTSLRQWSARKPLALLGPGWIGSWRFVEVAAAGVGSAGVRRE